MTNKAVDASPAFKQTELGLIPFDWEVRRIDEIAEVGSGGTPSRKIQEYWNGSIPWVTTSLIDFKVIDRAEESITKKGLQNSAAKLLRSGTLLMALYGQGKTRGKVGVLGFEAATNQACASISVQASVSGRYVFQYLASRYEAIRNSSNAGGQENLSGQIVKRILVPLPSIGEQQAIVAALDGLDRLRSSLDALISKRRDVKQAAMQQLLAGKRRLPGFTKPWSCQRIGEFADCVAGGTPSTTNPAFWGGAIRWMSSGELNLKNVKEVEGRITEQGLKNSSARLIPAYCVLVGLAGQGRTRGTVAMNAVTLSTNQSIAAILPNPDFHPSYLYYNLDSRYEELRSLSTGDGGRGGLNLTIIRDIEVPFPELAEQQAIASVLAEMDLAIDALETRRDKLRAIKQGMVQQLLTGRIRLL